MRVTAVRKFQKGFTIFEIILAASLLGVLTWVMAPSIKTLVMAKEIAHREAQYVTNQKIANALLAWSEAGGFDPLSAAATTKGTLPSPCTLSIGANRVQSGVPVSDDCPNGNSLVQYMLQEGVPYTQLSHDGSASANMRVYQKVDSSSLYQEAGLMYPSGPAVILSYQAGVVYSTRCGQNQACNQALSSIVPNPLQEVPDPGDLSGIRTMPDPAWRPKTSATSPDTDDYAVAYVSTLPIQQKFLAKTAQHLEAIRTGFKSYVSAKQAAAPASIVNFFPNESTVACANGATACTAQGATLQLSSPLAFGNQWCWDGWYTLDDSNSDILQQIGVGDASFGRTAWGGSVQYCRDYDPGAVTGKGIAPHFAALRIKKFVSLGEPPETADEASAAANNILISF